ncbi:MAG: hypothetical protein AAGF74_14660 [Pseudomonadota bacterium]
MPTIEGIAPTPTPAQPRPERADQSADVGQTREPPRSAAPLPPPGSTPDTGATTDRRRPDDAATAAFTTRALENRAASSEESSAFRTEVPMLGEVSDEQAKALEQAERTSGGSLSFVEKVAIVSTVDNLPKNTIEPPAPPFAAPQEAFETYGAIGTPNSATLQPELDITS